MNQNRNKLLQLLVGNLVNVIVHKVLEETAKEEILRHHYDKESLVSFEIAKRYREKINPLQRALPEEDISSIKNETIRRARKELELRISKGYQGINLDLIELILEKILGELKIT